MQASDHRDPRVLVAPPYALTFNPQVDLTGLATIALAIFTFALTVVTLILVLATRRTVADTRTEIGLHRQEVEEGHRPILIPVIDRTQTFMPVGAPEHTLMPVFDLNRIFVPIRNIGPGPALSARIRLDFASVAANEESTLATMDLKSGLAGVGSGETRIPSFKAPSGLSQLPGFHLSVEYNDVSGKPWQTRVPYDADDESFPSPKIGPGPTS